MKFLIILFVISTLAALGQGQGSSTSRPPIGSPCDPPDCKHEGHCTNFQFCDNETSTWQEFECTKGLFWNPEMNSEETGGKGGSCDFWENLSQETKDSYRNDVKCFPPCYYRGNGFCSPNYVFHPPDTDHTNITYLSCPTGLIWNQELEICDLCQNVSGCPCNEGRPTTTTTSTIKPI